MFRSRRKSRPVALEVLEERVVFSVPYGPYGLTATVQSASEIDLNWINNTNGPTATSDGVEVSTDGGNTYSVLTSALAANATK